MQTATTTKVNALRMMVASGVIRSARSKRGEYIHRKEMISIENPAEIDHFAPINPATVHYSNSINRFANRNLL